MNLLLSGQFLEEIRKKYRFLRIIGSEKDGKPILQVSVAQGHEHPATMDAWIWETIPLPALSENNRTVVQIYPHKIWDIEELL